MNTTLQVKTYDLHKNLLHTDVDGFEHLPGADLKEVVEDGILANYDLDTRESTHYMNQLEGYNENPQFILLRSFDTDEIFECSLVPVPEESTL